MLSKKTVMVVDDKEAIRDVLCTFLEKRGYRSLGIGDGKSALSIASEQKPDAVLLDIKMPGLSGIRTCYKLKQLHQSSPDTGIFIITGSNSSKNVKKSYDSGAIDVIRKPFNLDDINERLNIWFEVRNIKSEILRQMVYLSKVNWSINGI